MKLSTAAGFYFILQITAFFINVHGQCPGTTSDLPSIPNSYKTKASNLIFYSNGTIYGDYDVDCNTGYTLDPAIGGHVACMGTGSWSSPLPTCKPTVACTCTISDLFDYIKTAKGMHIISSKSFINIGGDDDNQAMCGSNMTVECVRRFTNVGGPLTIVCTDSKTWTPFPQCIYSWTTTTTVATPARCPVADDTFTFPNGYVSTNNAPVYSDNTAAGSAIVSCKSGYVIDTTSQGVITCNNGVWSTRPYCTKTPRCSNDALQASLNNPDLTKNLQVSPESGLYKDDNGDILVNSFVLFTCQSGYANADGNLKVTCNSDGQWSAFPSCTPVITPQ